MKRLLHVAAPLAFLLLLGIIGAVETGADIRLMWLSVPALITIAAATL